MSRRKARENAFIAMFESSFGEELDTVIAFGRQEAPEYAVDDFGEGLLLRYVQNAQEINALIEAKLKNWKADRLPRVSLAVLRLAAAEMLYADEDISSIVINEAVELSKKYGDAGDYQFVNGVLGSLARENGEEPGASSDNKKPQAGETV